MDFLKNVFNSDESLEYEVKMPDKDEDKIAAYTCKVYVIAIILILLLSIGKTFIIQHGYHLSGRFGIGFGLIILYLAQRKCIAYRNNLIQQNAKNIHVAQKISCTYKVKEKNGKIIQCKRINNDGLNEAEEEKVAVAYTKAMFFFQTNQYDSALKTLKDIEKTGTTDTELYSMLAIISYSLGNIQEALQYANKSIMFDKTEGDVIAVKGLALYHLGKKEKAIEWLKKAEAQKSTSILTDVYETLGRISYEDADYQTAFRYIEKGLAIDAKNYDLYILKADCYSKMQDAENLIATLLILEKLNNKNPAIYEWLANTYTILENFEKSLFYINKALKLEPQNQYYLTKKVDFLNTTKNHKEALKILKNIESLASEDKQVYIDIAETYYLMQDIENSLEYLEKYIFFNKDDFYGYKLKGILLFEQKKYQAALKNFLKVKDLGYCDVEIENYIQQIENILQ